jgi:hypothetical protein
VLDEGKTFTFSSEYASLTAVMASAATSQTPGSQRRVLQHHGVPSTTSSMISVKFDFPIQSKTMRASPDLTWLQLTSRQRQPRLLAPTRCCQSQRTGAVEQAALPSERCTRTRPPRRPSHARRTWAGTGAHGPSRAGGPCAPGPEAGRLLGPAAHVGRSSHPTAGGGCSVSRLALDVHLRLLPNSCCSREEQFSLAMEGGVRLYASCAYTHGERQANLDPVRHPSASGP